MAVAFASQYTDNFPQLLNQLGASLLVSTYQAGQLITVRVQENDLNTHFTAMEKPMGMCLRGGELAIGSAFQLVEYSNMPAVAPKVEPVGTHDSCFLPRNIRVTGDIDIHEMAYGKDELWIVNTRMSCLCTLDQQYSVVPKWRPPFISAYDLGDRCHLNGLALKDGEPAYVTALGETDTPGGWRGNKASGGLLMEVPGGRVIRRGLSMPHSPRWYQNRLWYLESGNGELAYLDPDTGNKTTVVELPGFTRGLDFVGRFAFVGLSQVRETAVFAGLPLTERVAERKCGIWVVDIEQSQIVAFLSFTGDVREIFAVQLIPGRYPAILDFTDPLLRSSYALPDDAIKDIAPDDPLQVLRNQAIQAYAKQDYEQAVKFYREILVKVPDDEQSLFHLGVVLIDSEQWEQAIETLGQVLKANPGHAEACNSLGLAYCGLSRWDEALAAFDKAIESDQKYSLAQFNRGVILLKQGNYKEGWPAFGWRWQLPEFTPFQCPQPQWKGEDISDKKLLVHTEQGNGDAIQCARFLPELRKRCDKLIVVCVASLRDLFSAMDCVDEVRLPGSLPSDLFDTYCPIMSICEILDVRLDTIPDRYPYLSIPAHVSVPKLKGREGRLKIGLCWQGSPTHKNDKHRSYPIEQLLELVSPEYDFYSLQVPVSSENAALLEQHHIQNLEPELTDYARTACYLTQMDLLISVDTSVAHLAGAFDIPVWIMLPENPDWRWGIEGNTSPWYQSARLFRQARTDDWPGIVQEVRLALDQFNPESQPGK